MPQHLHETAGSIYLDMNIEEWERYESQPLMQAHRRPDDNTTRLDPKLQVTALISPVPQLLQNNVPLTEDEIRRIREIISIARQEEKRLEALAGNGDAIYQESQEHLEDVQSFIYNHERLLSPILSLPAELLALIFTHCLPNLETTRRNCWPTWKDQPFRLSQVCQRWRTIALETPQLWTVPGFVNLATSETVGPDYRACQKTSLRLRDPVGYVAFLQRILNRSKAEDLCLWLFEPPVGRHEFFHHHVVDLLAKHASHITTLTIRSGPTTVNAFCAASDALHSESCSVTFPRLQRLVLDLYGDSTVGVNGFEHAPALRDVTIWGVNPFPLSLPWAQIHTYSEAADYVRGNLNTVLPLAQNLQMLDISHLDYDITPRSFDTNNNSQQASIPIAPIYVRLNFTVFQGSRHREQRLFGLLTHFHYPALQTLWINSYSYDLMHIFLTIAHDHYSLFPSPFINLTKLYYHSRDQNSSHLISFLNLAPNLEELSIEFPSDLLAPIDISTHQSIYQLSSFLGPALKRLFIHCSFSEQTVEYISRAHDLLRSAAQNFCNDLHRNPFPHVCLIFEGHDDWISIREAEANLNHHTTVLGRDLPSSEPLSTWRTEISILLSGGRTPRFSVARFNRVLVQIEQYELTSHQMRELYKSRLHLSLLHLSRAQDDCILGDEKYQFRARARKILERWEPLHRADLISAETNTLWVMKGTDSLVFISPNDPIRTGPDAMKLIYGLPD